MSVLNNQLAVSGFESIPKELVPLLISLEDLKDFCKTCTYFYYARESLTRQVLCASNTFSFIENQEYDPSKSKISFWQFISLIYSKTNFHKIFQYRAVRHGKVEGNTELYCPFGTVKSSLIRAASIGMLFKNSEDSHFCTFFFIRYPKITFHMPSKLFEKSYVPAYQSWWNDYPSILSKMVELDDIMRVRLTNVFLEYAKYCLLYKKDCDTVLELLKHNFPVLPKKIFFSQQQRVKISNI